jgi:hypothetical protein
MNFMLSGQAMLMNWLEDWVDSAGHHITFREVNEKAVEIGKAQLTFQTWFVPVIFATLGAYSGVGAGRAPAEPPAERGAPKPTTGIGDDPKATADKLANEPKPAESLTETSPAPPKASGSPKRVPAQQPFAPPGWKDTLNAFGKEIGWPGAGKVKVPAATADLTKLRAAGVTEAWAVEQARIYREVARLNPSNPTAAIRAEWLEVIAVPLRGTP